MRPLDFYDLGRRLADSEKAISRIPDQIRRMRNVCDYDLGHAIRFERRALSAEQLARLAPIVADGLLAALESFSPCAAPDGCDCPALR